MKKTLGAIFTIAILAVLVFGTVGSASAMENTGKGSGNGGGGKAGGGTSSTGYLSAYTTDAMASVLGLDPVALAAQLDAGETFYTIALAAGYTQDQFADLYASAQALAAELAAADGVIIYQNQNGNAAGSSQAGINAGICDGTGDCVADPLNTGTGGSGGGGGRRGGRRGGR